MRTFIVVKKITVNEVWEITKAPDKSNRYKLVGYTIIVPGSENWSQFLAGNAKPSRRR